MVDFDKIEKDMGYEGLSHDVKRAKKHAKDKHNMFTDYVQAKDNPKKPLKAMNEELAKADYCIRSGEYAKALDDLQFTYVILENQGDMEPKQQAKYLQAIEKRLGRLAERASKGDEKAYAIAVKAVEYGKIIQEAERSGETERHRYRKENKLEKTVSGIIGIIGIAVGFLSTFPRIIGNVIGAQYNSNNFISLIAFLVGIMGIFFFVKTRN